MQFIYQDTKKGGQFPKKEVVIFLPGWGFDGHIIELMEPVRQWLYPDSFLDPSTCVKEIFSFLEQRKIDKVILVGWSMGGYLALDFAQKYPEKIKSMYLLSLRKAWPHEEVQTLRASIIDNPGKALKGFYRQCFLGQKKIYNDFVKRLQEVYLQNIDQDLLLRGLDYLETVSTENLPDRGVQIYHGGKDIVAPIHEAAVISGTQTNRVENGSHAFFLADAFCLPFEKRKMTLRQKFSKAADSYDKYAFVQKKIVDILVEKLPVPDKVVSVLEFGCGTGNYTLRLAQKFKNSEITAIDFAEAMLRKTKEKLSGFSNISFQCHDAERYLADTTKTFDLITSNATMQWFDSFSEAIAGIFNRLHDDGVFIASIFGSQSLKELRQAMESLFSFKTGMAASLFPDKEMLQRALWAFKHAVVEEHIVTREYDSMHDLLTHIKKTGTGGWHAEHPPVLTRKRLALLDEWFDKQYGGYTITYQVFEITASK
jgi:malonyl-CoA O-methyltransferase